MHRGATNCTPRELEQKERLELVYARSQAPVMLSIERSVCGCDYGGNGWTTQSEADELATRLELGPGMRLLDLGAGTGWPALRFAKTRGCDVVLVDLPAAGLRVAEERAARDGLAARMATVFADAADLPLPDAGFDAISHSDLLCCLERKRAVLDECRRVIRPHGRMGFTVISIASGLTAKQRRRAIANGPELVESESDYPTLMARTSWSITAHRDLTADYAASCARQIQADEEHESDLAALIGDDEYAERLAGWRGKLAAIRDGLLLRELFVASPGAITRAQTEEEDDT
jgi:ubiquinone/menaquinone biosynthesis C-methylase UbiE